MLLSFGSHIGPVSRTFSHFSDSINAVCGHMCSINGYANGNWLGELSLSIL